MYISFKSHNLWHGNKLLKIYITDQRNFKLMCLHKMLLYLLKVIGVFLSTVTLFIKIALMKKKGLLLRAVTILYTYMQSSDIQILIPFSRNKLPFIKAINTVLQIMGDQRRKMD